MELTGGDCAVVRAAPCQVAPPYGAFPLVAVGGEEVVGADGGEPTQSPGAGSPPRVQGLWLYPDMFAGGFPGQSVPPDLRGLGADVYS